MERNEYISLRVENMSIEECKFFNEWEMAGEAAQIFDWWHSEELKKDFLEEYGIELTDSIIDSILDEGLEDMYYEDLYEYIERRAV